MYALILHSEISTINLRYACKLNLSLLPVILCSNVTMALRVWDFSTLFLYCLFSSGLLCWITDGAVEMILFHLGYSRHKYPLSMRFE